MANEGGMVKISVSIALLFSLLLVQPLTARVLRVEVKERKEVADLPDIARTGPYEILKGVIYLEVNPDDPANQGIVDLRLAPRNKNGNVEYSTDFELHQPVEPNRGNRRLMYIVSNRGHGGNYFSWLRDRDWLYSEGWSYLYCGWQCDLEESEELYNLRAPRISNKGKPITGKVLFEFFSYEDNVIFSMPLVDKASPAYPIATMDNSHATLTARQYPWEKAVELPRSGWQFARYEERKVIPDSTSLYIKEGFKPGWLYDLVYEAKDPKVVGLGLAAIRDVVSFFRYEEKDQADFTNRLFGNIEYALAYGHSQSGRLLNYFVHQNFNGDEKRRIVFDGIIANCPGAGKGEFNSRFAQATRYSSHLEDNLYMTDYFPLLTVEQYDPITSEKGDAFKRARDSDFLPKFMIINSSTDYWTRAASLLHTDVEGKTDAKIDSSFRIYLISGRAHTEGRTGIVARALLVALDKWISEGVKPPESRIPRIADGTLVDLPTFKKNFPRIPSMILPSSYYQPIRLDPGPRWRTDGIADNVPPREGPRYVTLVPQVDMDGNEIAGVRMPDVAVPLASFIGWNQRSLDYSNTLSRNAGNVWPFALSQAERIKKGDSRKSILERYPDKKDYLSELSKSLLTLRQQRFLLAEDVSILLHEAAEQDYWPIDEEASLVSVKTATAQIPVVKRGESAILTVTFDGSPDQVISVKAVVREAPQSIYVFNNDGRDDDALAGDNVWTGRLDVVPNADPGEYHLDIRAFDMNWNPIFLSGTIKEGRGEPGSITIMVK
jgi:hypothetical protein